MSNKYNLKRERSLCVYIYLQLINFVACNSLLRCSLIENIAGNSICQNAESRAAVAQTHPITWVFDRPI